MTQRKDSDEFYIIDLCDEVLGLKASRQHSFDFLRGDGTPGKRLPVDAYYPELNLVVEYRERQHSEPVPFFDKKITVSGVSRDEQRRLYDQRRRDILPEHGIRLVEISYADLQHDSRKRLVRDRQNDLSVIRKMLQAEATDNLSHNNTTANENTSSRSWTYRAYQQFGCLFVFAALAATLLLSSYLSIRVFHLNGTMSCVVIIAALFVVGFICHHYTTAVDMRRSSRSTKSGYDAAPIPPVCCPVCGSHNIGPADDGDYACMDCGLRWKQTF